MDELFNTREIALIAWTIIGLIAMLFSASIRKSLRSLMKILFSKNIIVLYGVMVTYIVLIVVGFYSFRLWDKSLLKDTVKWVLFAASVMLFQVNKHKEDKNFYRDTVKDLLKVTLIVEFLTDLYTFSLIKELLIVPFVVIIGAMMVFTEKSEEHKQVYSILTKLLSTFGLIVLLHTLYMSFVHYKELFTTDTFRSFILSPLLTVSFLPFIYCVSVYMKYELAFVTMLRGASDKKLVKFARFQAIRQWRFDTEGLKRWNRRLAINTPETKEELVQSIKEVKQWQQQEINPAAIPIEDGWTPYIAKDFLSPTLKTGYYEPTFDDIWLAISNVHYIGDKWSSNAVDFSISGTALVAYSLRIKLRVFTPELSDSLHNYYLKLVEELFEKAVGTSIPSHLAKAILKGKDTKSEINPCIISLKKAYWGNSKNSYDLILRIQHKAKPASLNLYDA